MKKLVKTIDYGVEICYRWDDRYVGQRIALGKYEPYVTKLFLENVEVLKRVGNDIVVVDVGANIGYYSLLAGKKGTRVWAFEPEEINFSILTKNVKDNGLENIKIYKKAVGDRRGRVRILKSEENYGNSRVGRKGELVEMVKLDDVVKEKVDMIKIDVEGWEGKVVEGAKRIISKYKPVIFLEYGLEKEDKKMIEFLRRVYGRIFWIDEYVQIYYPKVEKGMIAVGLSMGWNQIKNLRTRKAIKRGYNWLWQE